MKNKYISALLIALAVVAIAVIVYAGLKSPKQDPVENKTQKETSIPKSKTPQVPTPEPSINPLPSDTKEAVDSEIGQIENELNSLTDESIDDLSGIENEL